MKKVECYVRKSRLTLCIIGFIVLLYVNHTSAQISEDIKLLTHAPVSNEEQITMILDEVEQGVRCNQVYRVNRWFENRYTQQASKQSQFIEAFKRGETIISNKPVSFCIDSVRITIAGDSAEVRCLVGDQNDPKKIIVLSMKKERGRWYFTDNQEFVSKISEFVRSKGFGNVKNSFSKKGYTKSLAKTQNSVQSSGINIVESNHLFIPKKNLSSPEKWFITRSDQMQHLQKDIFEELTEIEFMPLATSGNHFTDGIMFVLFLIENW